ncbi:hypothetical protein [Cellulomonas palmilytica]|uniref:hypothetical protein n=1 Tax=Cellulomonas palmilytica TaxID=2608402 RepID=UPI001F2F2777|nr:hypothetical protein [Cellulomonas palmilytica]UJP38530.1 hypothetical protein F1D97_08720 [Cellulomonas palmilytica]
MDRRDGSYVAGAVLPLVLAAVVLGVGQLVWLGVSWRTVLVLVALVGAAWCRTRSARAVAPPARVTPGEPDPPPERPGAGVLWALGSAVLLLGAIVLLLSAASTR